MVREHTQLLLTFNVDMNTSCIRRVLHIIQILVRISFELASGKAIHRQNFSFIAQILKGRKISCALGSVRGIAIICI
jgi:hypothetical protein